MAQVNSEAFRFIFESNPQVIDVLKTKVEDLNKKLQNANQLYASGSLTMDKYVRSVQNLTTRKQSLEEKVKAATGAWNLNTTAMRQGAYAFQDLASTSGDLGQKLNSVTNNLQQVLVPLGAWGAAATVAVTAGVELYKNWDSVASLFETRNPFPKAAETAESLGDKLDAAKKSLKDLEEQGFGNRTQQEAYKKLSAEVVELEEKRTKALQDQKLAQEARDNVLTDEQKQRETEVGKEFTNAVAGKTPELAQEIIDVNEAKQADENFKKLVEAQNALKGMKTEEQIQNDPNHAAFLLGGGILSDLPEYKKLKDAQAKEAQARADLNAGVTSQDKDAAFALIGRAQKGDAKAFDELKNLLPADSDFQGVIKKSQITSKDMEEDDKAGQAKIDKRNKKIEAATDEATDAFIDMVEADNKEQDKIKKEDLKNAEKTAEQRKKDAELEQQFIAKYQPVANQFLGQVGLVGQTDPRAAAQMRKQFNERMQANLLGTADAPSELVGKVGWGKAEEMRSHIMQGLEGNFNRQLSDARQPLVKDVGRQEGTAMALQQVAGIAADQIAQTKELQEMVQRLLGQQQESRQRQRGLKSQFSRQ